MEFSKCFWCIFVIHAPNNKWRSYKNKNVYDSMVSQGIFKFYFGTFALYCYKIVLYSLYFNTISPILPYIFTNDHCIPEVAKFSQFLDKWRKITTSRFLLNLVKGYHLQLRCHLLLFHNYILGTGESYGPKAQHTYKIVQSFLYT